MPPSTSPPRPPCYAQQMPAYSPADAMFYNLPVYGGAMEGPPVYTEAFDLGPAGPYTEDAYYTTVADNHHSHQHHHHHHPFHHHPHHPANAHAQDLDQRPPPNIATASQSNEHHRPPSPTTTTTTNNNNNNNEKMMILPLDDGGGSPPERNSATPVVSLLSIDHQQEKDLVSMQGGRRPPPPRKTQSQVFPSNGYITNYAVGYNGYTYPRTNGFDVRKRRSFERRASLRTDSNSSASVVDENRNEEKLGATRNTPPPAPYSPMMGGHQYSTRVQGKNYSSTTARYNGGGYAGGYGVGRQGGNGGAVSNAGYDTTVSSSSSPAKVHVTASQGYGAQARRSRRSIRRGAGGSGVSSGGLNEIGAGDAPLPPTDVGDVCKKFETIKL